MKLLIREIQQIFRTRTNNLLQKIGWSETNLPNILLGMRWDTLQCSLTNLAPNNFANSLGKKDIYFTLFKHAYV